MRYVEALPYREILPNIAVSVFLQTLVVKPVDLGGRPRLVVSPQNRDPLRVSNLERGISVEYAYGLCICHSRAEQTSLVKSGA